MKDSLFPAEEEYRPATKRSFFKTRPSTKTATLDSNEDIFTRPSRLLDEIIAENQRKHVENVAQKPHMKVASASGAKKRKSSGENYIQTTKLEGTDGLRDHSVQTCGKDASSTKISRENTLISNVQDHVDHTNSKINRDVIELASSDSSDSPQSLATRQKYNVAKEPVLVPLEKEDSSDSDAELAELAAKARERRRAKELGLKPPSSDIKANASISSPASQPAPSSSPDPVIEILITSAIPNTKPLIVQRRQSQRLKEVRVAWCERQEFSSDFTESVFFTWRSRRLYDVTTCKNLQFSNSKKQMRDSFEHEEVTRVHLEACTEELLAAAKQATATSAQKVDGVSVKGGDDASAEAKTEQIKVKVRALGFEDHKLIVKPTTVVSRIIHAFRIARSVPPPKAITLTFDGENLSPESTVQDYDIDDLDYIDAHIK